MFCKFDSGLNVFSIQNGFYMCYLTNAYNRPILQNAGMFMGNS